MDTKELLRFWKKEVAESKASYQYRYEQTNKKRYKSEVDRMELGWCNSFFEWEKEFWPKMKNLKFRQYLVSQLSDQACKDILYHKELFDPDTMRLKIDLIREKFPKNINLILRANQ